MDLFCSVFEISPRDGERTDGQRTHVSNHGMRRLRRTSNKIMYSVHRCMTVENKNYYCYMMTVDAEADSAFDQF